MAPAHHSTAATNVFGLNLAHGSAANAPMMHNEMMIGAASGFDHGPFGEPMEGIRGKDQEGSNSVINGGGNDGMTRDFLGLRGALSHRDILNMAGLDQCYEQQQATTTQQSKKPWN